MTLIFAWLSRRPRTHVLALCTFGVLLVGGLDWAAGAEVSTSIFYVLPVGCAAWFVSRRAAMALAAASALSWYLVDSATREYSAALIPVWNATVRLGFFVMIGSLLSTLRLRLDEEERLADTDLLTGMLNRRAFYERAQEEIERSARFSHPFTVAYVDVDDFKGVNDRLGHAGGDDLLQRLANALSTASRPQDVLARLGGDEFAVLYVETSATAAPRLLERVHDGLRAAGVTVSIGAITYESAPSDVEQMIHAADSLMYEAKRGGKNETVLSRWPEPVAAS